MLVHILTAKNIRMLHSSTREVSLTLAPLAGNGFKLSSCFTRSCMPTKTKWARTRLHRWTFGPALRARSSRSSSLLCHPRSRRRASRHRKVPRLVRPYRVLVWFRRDFVWRCCPPGVIVVGSLLSPALPIPPLQQRHYASCSTKHFLTLLPPSSSSSSRNLAYCFYLIFLSLPVDAGDNSSKYMGLFNLFFSSSSSSWPPLRTRKKSCCCP